MTRLFLDTSMLFAAIHSAKGHARDLILAVTREDVTLIVSQYVLAEASRAFAEKAPERSPLFDYLAKVIPWETVDPTKRQVVAASKHVDDPKDAPILAAARKAKLDALVTLDRKHLLGRPAVASYIRAKVLTPQEAVALFTQKE